MSRELDLLKLCLTTPNTLPPVIIGPPGIGKTQRIRHLAKQLDWDLVTFSVGDVGEGAFGVVPVPQADGFLSYPAPDWVKKFSEGRPGLLFLDDVHASAPALQAPIAGLILDGRIGSYQLPPSVRRIGAMNPTNQGAGAWDFAANLCNRFQYHTWVAPSATEWTDWLLESAGHQEGQGWTKARALAAAYHRRHAGQLLEDPDKVLVGRFPPAYATPRSWETAIRMLATCLDHNCLDNYPILAEGILGKPIAIEWATWLRRNDLPDPEDLLADPKSWKPDGKESDKVFATCFSVSEAAVQDTMDGKKFTKKDKTSRWNNAWRVLEIALPLGKGMVAVAARKLAKPEHRPEGGILDTDVRKIITQLKDVIHAAGLI